MFSCIQPSPLHSGDFPFQAPSARHVLMPLPNRINPWLQEYVAVFPTAVPVSSTTPFSGLESGLQLTATERGKTEADKRENIGILTFAKPPSLSYKDNNSLVLV